MRLSKKSTPISTEKAKKSFPYQPPTSNIYYNSGKVNLSALPEFLFLEELEM